MGYGHSKGNLLSLSIFSKIKIDEFAFYHGFKNRTGPAGPTGSTGNRLLIRSGYD